MATVIVERPTIIAHLMPRGVGARDETDIAFCALLAIYIQYFKMVLQPQGEPAWVCNYSFVLFTKYQGLTSWLLKFTIH